MKFDDCIRSYPDFPKKNVLFWDVAPLLTEPKMFHQTIDAIKNHFEAKGMTHIVAIEAKGFTLGAALAYAMSLPLILIRKPGLIPGEVITASFVKEYGQGEYQMKKNSLKKGDRALIVYDILAAAGASKAAIELVEAQNAEVAGCAYVIELDYLSGRKDLPDYDIFSLTRRSQDEIN